jgi:hypothetical protein
MIFAGRYNIAGYHIIKPNLGYSIACLLIIFISLFRFDMGWDYSTYWRMIDPVFDYEFLKKSTEPLSFFIYSIAAYFHSPLLMYILFGSITYILVFSIINKYSLCKYESLIIYVSMFYFTSWSNLRQSLAGAVLFFGFKYIKDKKIVRYIILVIIASGFHLSAIVGIILYPLYYNKLIYTLFLLILAVIGVKYLLPIFIGDISTRYMSHLQNIDMQDNGGRSMRYVYILLFCYCFVVAIIKKRIKECEGFFSIVALGLIFPFILGGHIGGRVAEYFIMYFMLLIPSVNTKINIYKRVLSMVPFYLYFFLFLFTTVYSSKSTEYVPYRFYFLTDRSYFFQNKKFGE